MSLSADDVARWLVTPAADGGAGLQATVTLGPKLPPQPDQVVVLTRYGGPGAIEENAFEVIAFQARCRGKQGPGGSPVYTPAAPNPDASKDAYVDVENLATTVDALLLDTPIPVRIGGHYVRTITGGPPAFLTADSARRVHFTGNYLFTVARF